MCAEASKRWRQKFPEKAKEQKRLYYERNKLVLAARRAPGNLARSRATRIAAITILGGHCVSCGFSDERALQIDHIEGGGGQERKIIKSRSAFYRKVVADQAVYQLLCANCNWIKRAENQEYSWRHRESAALKLTNAFSGSDLFSSTSTITED